MFNILLNIEIFLSFNVNYYYFVIYYYFIQRTQQFNFIDITNNNLNYYVNKKYK